MKSAAENFGSRHTEHGKADNHAPSHSSRIHYVLVAVLLVVAYLISTLIGTEPGAIPSGIGSGFLFSWLTGGLITLGLLTFAAKR